MKELPVWGVARREGHDHWHTGCGRYVHYHIADEAIRSGHICSDIAFECKRR